MTGAVPSAPIEKGIVKFYLPMHGYGFIVPDKGGRDIFFHAAELARAGLENIAQGVQVEFTLGTDYRGRIALDRFCKIDGKEVVEWEIEKNRGRVKPLRVAPRVQRETKSSAHAATSVDVQVPTKLIVEAEVTLVPSSAEEQSNKIDPSEWLEVRLRKVRPDHTGYAEHETLGQIKVPWPVLQTAKIKIASNRDRFEVRCKEGEDLPEAIEIRRY